MCSLSTIHYLSKYQPPFLIITKELVITLVLKVQQDTY